MNHKLLQSIKQDNFSYFAKNIGDINGMKQKDLLAVIWACKFADKKYRDNFLRYCPSIDFTILNPHYVPRVSELGDSSVLNFKKNYPKDFEWMLLTSINKSLHYDNEAKILSFMDKHLPINDIQKIKVYLHFENKEQILANIEQVKLEDFYGNSLLEDFEILKALDQHFGWEEMMSNKEYLGPEFLGHIKRHSNVLKNIFNYAVQYDKDIALLGDFPGYDLCLAAKEKKHLETINTNNKKNTHKI